MVVVVHSRRNCLIARKKIFVQSDMEMCFPLFESELSSNGMSHLKLRGHGVFSPFVTVMLPNLYSLVNKLLCSSQHLIFVRNMPIQNTLIGRNHKTSLQMFEEME